MDILKFASVQALHNEHKISLVPKLAPSNIEKTKFGQTNLVDADHQFKV